MSLSPALLFLVVVLTAPQMLVNCVPSSPAAESTSSQSPKSASPASNPNKCAVDGKDCEATLPAVNRALEIMVKDTNCNSYDVWTLYSRVSHKVKLNAETVVSMLTVFRNKNDLYGAITVWNAIIMNPGYQINPNRSIYELLIEIYANNARYDLVKQCYYRMRNAGLDANENDGIERNVLRAFQRTEDIQGVLSFWQDRGGH